MGRLYQPGSRFSHKSPRLAVVAQVFGYIHGGARHRQPGGLRWAVGIEEMDDDRSTSAHGSGFQDLSANLADLHTAICDTRPDRVDSAVHGRILTCVLEGGLTAQ